MTTRLTLPATLLLTLLATGAVAAQAPQPAPARPAESAAALPDERTALETRQRLHEVLEQYPPSVAQVLRLDPSLLTRPDYLAPYPALAAFLAQHAEVEHNPAFFLGGPGGPGGLQLTDARGRAANAIEAVFLGFEFLLGFVTAACALTWIARSAIEHRRWLRAARIQTDAHTKIVDRLTSNEDLLAYMQSAVGQRFLSSSIASPTADAATPRMVAAPVNRILWSVQAGIVIVAGGAGLWIARNGLIDEVAQPLQAVAILAMALGIGFVLSAFASYALSRQLGLMDTPEHHA
jgi:hypothetical protein